MSNLKSKSENYINLGGINNKYSPYVLAPPEFLSIINYDFQTPGSLTQRWGSTMYTGQTFPGQVNSLIEYQRLNGASYVVASYSGGIFYGATTGQFQGLSMAMGITFGNAGFGYGNPFDVAGNSAMTGVTIDIQQMPYQGNSQNYFLTAYIIGTPGQTQSDNTLSYSVLDDYLFACDGNKFFKFNGSTSTFVTSPPVISSTTKWVTLTNLSGGTLLGVSVGASPSSIAFYASYVNDRGFEGNIYPIGSVTATMNNASLGGSFVQAQVAFIVPPQYNIQSVNYYCYYSSSLTLSVNATFTWNEPYVFMGNVLLASLAIGETSTLFQGQSYYISYLGSTLGGQSFLAGNQGQFPNPNTNLYLPLGFTLVSGTLEGFAPNTVAAWQINSYFPRYSEVYQNRLFLAGFSLTPSTVWFSDVAEPEGYQPSFNFEVRTNDADIITCMKAYATNLYIFKKNSFHVLLGDNPNNFNLQEISNLYGCLNNRAAIIYQDILLFLDRKGIMMYNGASLTVISQKIQQYFDRMNYNVALNTAIMVHDKIRNQIMISIPIDGSSTNNITIVYDYLVTAWTTYAGFNPTVFATIQGYNLTKYPAYGDAQGRINWMGPSFTGDNGSGMTLYFKTRFSHDMGDSVQKQYRRLYLNADAPAATLSIACNIFQDYGSSIVKSATFIMGSFQNRIDFGVSAKSMAFETWALNPVYLRIHGYTIEQRLQRNV